MATRSTLSRLPPHEGRAPKGRGRNAPAPTRRYQRREPEQTTLYAVLREHLDSFLSLMERGDGPGLPRFVKKELRAFLSCGILAKGFARFRCTACGCERLVAFSCKGRGFCPSCGGKRMTQLAAHLVDNVIPFVPTRQYVLSLPWQLRMRLAYDHAAQKAVLGIYANALLNFYRSRAEERGIRGAQTGAVTFIQRFGSSLNLNLHLHTHVLDGVFTEQQDGSLRFHPLRPPTQKELRVLVSIIRSEVLTYAVRHGLLADDEPDPDDGPMPTLMAASAQHLRALGPRPGDPLERQLTIDPETTERRKSRFAVRYDGFDLHAGLSVPARKRKVLEQVLRYCLRPAVSHDRLQPMPDGRIRLALKTPWRDGTSHLYFEPLELIARLTALIPRPHKNLVVYHGVLAARSKWRKRVVAFRRPAAKPPAEPSQKPAARAPRHNNHAWATMMRRAFELDVLSCPRCSGRLQLIACVTKPSAVRAILQHLSLPADAPNPAPARAPPWAHISHGQPSHDDLDAFDAFDAIDDDPHAA